MAPKSDDVPMRKGVRRGTNGRHILQNLGMGWIVRSVPNAILRHLSASSPFTHNRDHFDGPCTALELWTLRFVFPLLQFLCLGGNLLNLLVYSFPYFGDNSSVHLLRAKAVANLFFVQCRLLEVLHAWVPLQSRLEWLYWHSRPWMITMGNLNGTISTWQAFGLCLTIVLLKIKDDHVHLVAGPPLLAND